MSTQLTFDNAMARAAADAGMRQALAHAEEEHFGWPDLAYLFLERYARQHQRFISEDVSDASIAWGLVQPPTLRAWGGIYRRAKKAGLIVCDGVGRSWRRHASICPMWRSLVFGLPA